MAAGISLEDAVARMCGSVTPLGVERLPLEAALGRTLAEEVRAPLDQPPFDRSPLDGYALRAADLVGASRTRPAVLRVVDRVYAGDEAKTVLEAGQAVQVTTGAMLPPGCDCVAAQEDTDQGDPVAVFVALAPCQNYVRRGEDYRAGALLLEAGARLDAAALGVLAGAGVPQVTVRRRPKVGLMTTGDEVVQPGMPRLPGKIYGSNGILLSARLAELGISAATAHAGDHPAAAAHEMRELLAGCDLLITTGGVSVGEKDVFHQALPLLGAERLFWRVNLKPGGPAMYSVYEGKPILSLSGNPFAAFTTFELLARPLLAALSGEEGLGPHRAEGILDTPYPKPSPRRRFVRGRYADRHVTLPEGHASGMLASLMGCNCLVELPAGSPPAAKGQRVQVWLL